LLGGHIDFQLSTLGNFTSAYKNGQVRFLAVAAREDEPRLAGITTMESQGYKVHSYVSRAISVPAGTPPAVVEALSRAIKKSIESEPHKKSMEEMNMTLVYMDPGKLTSFWDSVERQTKPLLLNEAVK